MRGTALFLLLPVFGALPVVAQSVPAYAIPNTKHYRESGVGNASGRSGSAHLTARALLDKDGNTTVEVTTGLLDSPTAAPGSFAKVQFKPLDPDGDALLARNFNQIATPTGYYSFSWPSLYQHQQTQIQANITGIDNRTDVVTVVDTVKLRPDLAIHKLFLPDSPISNTPVTITANVVELNGDTSATTECQLFIDGNLADHASNVYVDAAGGVSCAFSHTFPSAGPHTIQVTAANVMPADWDTSNNSASGTINIVDLNTNIAEHGSASFSDHKGGFPVSHIYSQQAWQSGVLVHSVNNTTGAAGEEQDAYSQFFSGNCVAATNAVPYQFPADVTYSETMDGTTVYTAKAIGITGSSTTFPVNKAMCGSTAVQYTQQLGSGVADDYTFNLTSYTYYDSASHPLFTYQQVDSARNAGDVTYFSSDYECAWLTDCTNPPTNYFYMWNTSSESVMGKLVTPGNTWTPSITVTDSGGNGFGGSLAVSLFSSQYTAGQPNKCTNTGPDMWGYTYQTCTSTTNNYTLTQGNTSY